MEQQPHCACERTKLKLIQNQITHLKKQVETTFLENRKPLNCNFDVSFILVKFS